MFTRCSGSSNSDRNNVVNDVTIGNQVWMARNLNLDKFRNGDPIPEAKTEEEWDKANKNQKPAWSYYNNNSVNGDPYGKLYNWYAVSDPRGLAPEGWKIPSDEDWSELTDFLGGESVAGEKMKFTNFWTDTHKGSGNGTNESGFAGLPGGYRGSNGPFYNIGIDGYWWSSTESTTSDAWKRYLYHYDGLVFRDNANKGYGFSVRCLRN